TQFESFPEFMETIDEVRQIDERRLHWKASAMGQTREWDAEITQQEPDRVIAWRSTSGAQNAGTVRFQELEPNKTRVTVQMEYQPESAVESAADMSGLMERQLESDLQR